MRLDDFIESLYRSGWKNPNDAQYTEIKKLHRKIFPVIAELEEEIKDHWENISLYEENIRS